MTWPLVLILGKIWGKVNSFSFNKCDWALSTGSRPQHATYVRHLLLSKCETIRAYYRMT